MCFGGHFPNTGERTVSIRGRQPTKVEGRPTVRGEPCACREKFGPRPIFKIFSLDQIRADLRRPRKKEVRKRRASIYRSSPSDAVEHFLVSHVTGWAILGYPALELDKGIFPLELFFGHSLAAKFKFECEKNAIAGKRAWCKAFEFLSGFRLATRVLERQWTLAPFYRWYKKMEQKVAGSIPEAQPLFSPSTHVRKQSLPVWHDDRATRPYAHWHLFCCTKSSERYDVDHVGVSGNLCKTTTPGANESDFCRQVWSQCKQINILAVKVAWASAGVATGLECPCMNASSTSYPLAIHKGRPGMQRLPGDRSWTVSRGWIMTGHKRERKQNYQSSSALGTGGNRKKTPGEHNLHVTERHTSVTGNTCNEIQPSQNMKRAPSTLRRRSGTPTTPSSS